LVFNLIHHIRFSISTTLLFTAGVSHHFFNARVATLSGDNHHHITAIQSVILIGLLPLTHASHLVLQFRISLAAAVSLLSSARLENQFSSAIFLCHSLNEVSILVALSACSAVHLLR
jgi:hypothetical protein